MDINFQRAIDRFVGTPVCALLSLADKLRRRRVVGGSPRKILVILLSEMGSLVLAYPMFARLRQRYPEASIYALVFARNREALSVLGAVPEERILTIDDRSFARFASGSFKALRTLRALEIDVTVDCELFARTSSIFSYLSGAHTRVGFHRYTQEGLYRGSFINRAVMYNPYRHLSQQFLTLADAIESDTVPAGKSGRDPTVSESPVLRLSGEEIQQAAGRLHADFPAIRNKSLVLVNPGGGILAIRAWPIEYYCRLCAQLLGEGHAIGIIGREEDGPLGEVITAHCRNPLCIDLTGYTKSVRHLLALYHRASLLVTNDGGPGQLAALTSIPALVLFGPETPLLYKPTAKNVQSVYLSIPCSPCVTAYNHRRSPCDGDNQCLKQISPEQVLAKAREMLGAPLRVRATADRVA